MSVDITGNADKIANVGAVVKERGQTYGHPFDDFSKAVRIKNVLKGCPDPHMRHVLEMIAVKMARLVESPSHLDSWVDIAGYATTAGMILDRRNEIHEETIAEKRAPRTPTGVAGRVRPTGTTLRP